MPPWSRRLGVFDLETTGVDVHRDRIVTAHVGVLDASGAAVDGRDWLADPGVPIPERATAVHGVTTAHARAHGAPAAQVVAEVVAALRALFDAGVPVVAYNAPFDFSVLHAEARRHAVPGIDDPHPVVDPLVVDRACDRYRPGKRTLTSACAHYAVRLDDAHTASADAVAAGRLAQALAARFAEDLNLTPGELHDRQRAWSAQQAAGLTDYLVRVGRMPAGEHVDGSWPIR